MSHDGKPVWLAVFRRTCGSACAAPLTCWSATAARAWILAGARSKSSTTRMQPLPVQGSWPARFRDTVDHQLPDAFSLATGSPKLHQDGGACATGPAHPRDARGFTDRPRGSGLPRHRTHGAGITGSGLAVADCFDRLTNAALASGRCRGPVGQTELAACRTRARDDTLRQMHGPCQGRPLTGWICMQARDAMGGGAKPQVRVSSVSLPGQLAACSSDSCSCDAKESPICLPAQPEPASFSKKKAHRSGLVIAPTAFSGWVSSRCEPVARIERTAHAQGQWAHVHDLVGWHFFGRLFVHFFRLCLIRPFCLASLCRTGY